MLNVRIDKWIHSQFLKWFCFSSSQDSLDEQQQAVGYRSIQDSCKGQLQAVRILKLSL